MEKSIHFLDDISQNCHSELPRRRLGDNDGFQLEVVPRMNGVSFTYLFIVFGLPAASAHTGRYWAHLGTVFEKQIISCCSKRRLSSQSGKWISSKDLLKQYPINLMFTKALAFYQESCGFNYFLPKNSQVTKMSRLQSRRKLFKPL